MPSPANENQVGGDHYKVGGEEHWDRVARLGLDYFQGQITKYVERWKKKGGVQDLEKAAHFLAKYAELAKAGALPDWKPPEPAPLLSPHPSMLLPVLPKTGDRVEEVATGNLVTVAGARPNGEIVTVDGRVLYRSLWRFVA